MAGGGGGEMVAAGEKEEAGCDGEVDGGGQPAVRDVPGDSRFPVRGMTRTKAEAREANLGSRYAVDFVASVHFAASLKMRSARTFSTLAWSRSISK